MKKLKLFFACLLMAVLSIGQMWAGEVSFAKADFSWTGTQSSGNPVSATKDGVTITCSAANIPSGGYMVFNKNGTLTISSTAGNITAIDFTCTNSDYTGNMTDESGLSTTEWSTTVSCTGSKTTVRVSSIVVTVGGGDPVAVTGVSLDETAISLEVGENQTLTATIAPPNATNQNVTWTSSNTSVATVDNGVVTAVAAGNANITVATEDGSFSDVCAVTVTAAQPKITITQDEVASFTNVYAQYSWTAGGVSGKLYAYKNGGIQFNSSKDGYYVYNTDPIPGKIRKIAMTKASSATTRTWTPYVSTSPMTSASGDALTAKEVASTTTWDVTGDNSYFYLTVAGGSTVISSIVITYEEAAATQVATPEISGTESFYPSTSVSITCGTDGAAIYYTTDGSDPSSGSTLYSAPFMVNADGTTTVKAIAIKAGLDNSDVASKDFTKATPLATLQDIFNAATGEEVDQFITFSNDWVVTGVSTNGKNAYLTDGTKGLILYNSSASPESPVAGLAVGKTLSGTKTCSLTLYNGSAELTGFTAEGLTIVDGTIPSVNEDQEFIENLSGVNTGALIKISGQCTSTTNNNKTYYKIGEYQLYNTLFAFEAPEVNANYECTGVYVQFNSTKEICPRSAADIVEQQEKQNANTQWVAASKTARIGDATTNWWSTESDGAKSFISTNEAVATIDAEGAITLVAPGTTTLKFSTAANDTYFAGPEVSMVLTVKAALPAGGAEFTWDATAQSYTDQQVLETVTNAPNPVIEFAKGGSNDNKWFNNGNAVRFYKTNSITVTAPENKLLHEININFTSTQPLTTDVVTYNLSGTVGTWSGLAKSVTFTNSGTAYASITSINVIYADGTETSLSISDINLKTTDDETALSITKNVDATIIYEGLDESVATISANKVTPVGEGSTTVTASIAAGSNYTAASTTFTITVAAKTIPEMSFPQPSYDANLGSDFTEPTLTIAPAGLTVKYSSDNAAVSVDENTGEITLNTEGTAVITATSVETTDYAVNTASYTLNVTDPYKDVLTATGIGQSGYGTWTNKTFTTETKYDGYSTTGTGTNVGAIQMNTTNPGGIVNISTIGYLKALSATAHSGNAKSLNIYAKNTPYASSADLYDNDKRGTLIGTIDEDGGDMDFVDGFAYSDNYKYIGIKANGGAVYYDEIVIKWTPATINKYTVTYEAGEASGDNVVVPNVEEGTPITLAAADTYTKDGYTFMGWNDGTQTYAAGASYTVNDNVTFTAQWAQNFTVTYKAGEAGETQVVRTVPAGAYNLESCSFAYANHAFDGWQNGSNKYNAGAEVTISENMEFVAQWVEAMNPITVTFKVNVEKSSTKTLYKDGINLSVTGGDLNRTDNYRCYASNSMNIATELGNITNIVITSVEGNTAQDFSIEGDNGNYAYESLIGTWTGSSAAIQLNASSQVRMTQIQVTYIPSAYLRNVTDANNFGTLCLPFNGTIEGAELLEFVDKDADNVYLGNSDATVHAGKPYIFRSTAAQIKVSFTDNNFAAADNHNGLYGTYVRMENDELNGKCLISNNQYYNIDTDDCSLNAYRAYFMLSEVPSIGGNLARRRYAIGNGAPQVATGIDALNASETPVKMIIDGQLYILRGEKLFDATGRLVK